MDSDRITWLRERLKQRFDVAEYDELCTLEAAAALAEAQQRQAQDDAKPAEPTQWARSGRVDDRAP